jgi:hypothetical protein
MFHPNFEFWQKQIKCEPAFEMVSVQRYPVTEFSTDSNCSAGWLRTVRASFVPECEHTPKSSLVLATYQRCEAVGETLQVSPRPGRTTERYQGNREDGPDTALSLFRRSGAGSYGRPGYLRLLAPGYVLITATTIV